MSTVPVHYPRHGQGAGISRVSASQKIEWPPGGSDKTLVGKMPQIRGRRHIPRRFDDDVSAWGKRQGAKVLGKPIPSLKTLTASSLSMRNGRTQSPFPTIVCLTWFISLRIREMSE